MPSDEGRYRKKKIEGEATLKRSRKDRNGGWQKSETLGCGGGRRTAAVGFHFVLSLWCPWCVLRWPASAFLTNSSPRQPLISALQPPTFFLSVTPRPPYHCTYIVYSLYISHFFFLHIIKKYFTAAALSQCTGIRAPYTEWLFPNSQLLFPTSKDILNAIQKLYNILRNPFTAIHRFMHFLVHSFPSFAKQKQQNYTILQNWIISLSFYCPWDFPQLGQKAYS